MLNVDGFVCDYYDFKLFKIYIDDCFDYCYLNDVLDMFMFEVMVKYFFDWCYDCWLEMIVVKVSEIFKIWVEYCL